MTRIFFQGLGDGLHPIKQDFSVDDIPGIYDEFSGIISFIGELRILGNRYTLTGKATCTANLICDYSLKEFDEIIEIDYHGSFIADDQLYHSKNSNDIREVEEHIIAKEEKFLDITEDLREDFTVCLPMKRIAPEYRGKDFEQIFPEYSRSKILTSKKKAGIEIDDRWEILKKIRIN